LKKYREDNQGPKLLGAPIGEEEEGAKEGDTKQRFTKGCIYSSSNIMGLIGSATYYSNDSFLCCCSDIILPDSDNPEAIGYKHIELAGLNINQEEGQIEFIFRSEKAEEDDKVIDLNDEVNRLKKIFLQALAIPNNKQQVSLDIIYRSSGPKGSVRIDNIFKDTDIADAMLYADVMMKDDIPSGSGLAGKWYDVWTELIKNSPYKSEIESLGFMEYPSILSQKS